MKYLGIDWGLKRVGLALSEGLIATPYKTLEIKSFEDGIKKIQGVADQEGAELIVIGKPEGGMSKVVDKVVKKLHSLNLYVKLGDETLSSQEALRQLIKMGVSKKSRRDDNSMAAAIILQRYLDQTQ